MNSVNLTGRLTRDIETRQTQSGKSVSNFTLAVDGQSSKVDERDDTSFINCVLWNHDGLLPYLTKGKQIGASGRLQTRSYENKQGQKVFVTEVVVFGIDLLGGNNSGQSQNSQPQQNYNQQANQNLYGGNNAPQGNPFNNGGGSIDVDDSQLPF